MGHHEAVIEHITACFFIGPSPSGKATDFDSVISWVRIPPAQLPRMKLLVLCGGFFMLNGFSIHGIIYK